MKRVALFMALFLLAPRAETKGAAPYGRSVDDVAWAIGLSQPKMGLDLRRSYAGTVLREASKHDIDAFTLVAMGHFESRWNASLVGGAGNKCHGIGQHCVQFKYRYCMGDKYESPECLAKRQWLLNGHNNVVEMALDITSWREYCKKLTGHQALFHRWLYGYQGHAADDKTRQCGMKKTKRGWKDLPKPDLVRKVMDYRLKLDRTTRSER